MAWRWLFTLFLWLPATLNDWSEASRRHFLNPDSELPFSIASKQYRTAFHFQPPQNWLNDPNGPMYYNGIYHLFYQYNPYSAEWGGNLTWGHSISTDLINWTPLDIALRPSEPFDIKGCWSGSATILPGNKPIMLYTGINEAGHNVQNIALPKNTSDPFLLEWVKPAVNPVMVAEGVNATQFRDPSTCWLGKDGLWRTTVGAEDFERKAKALLYRSKDFAHWTRADWPLFSTNSSSMVECVDFYPVSLKGRRGLDTSTMDSEDVRHVLKLGVFDNLHDYYLIGRYVEDLDKFEPENVAEDYHHLWPRYDYGSFYASKTFFDSEKKRRILWAWSNESDTISDDIAKGWAGVQTVPRTIWLDENGKQLVQWPVRELESLRREMIKLKDVELSEGAIIEIKGVKSSQTDIEVEFLLPELERAELLNHEWKLDDAQMACNQMDGSVPGSIGPFGLLVLASPNLEEHTAIFFRIFKTGTDYAVLMCSDQRKSSLWSELYMPAFGGFVPKDIQKEGKISLRTLIDHSVVESFGAGGRTCITARVYPKLLLTGNTRIYVFNNGSETVKIGELKAWQMANAKIN